MLTVRVIRASIFQTDTMNLAPETYQKIIAGKWYMDFHYQQRIDLSAISRNACISRFHFHRLFTRIYRKTPHRYLTLKRIGLAATLLADDKLTVTDICNSVGFESMGSFSVLFKKETGTTPSEFRKQLNKKKKEIREQPAGFIPNCFMNNYGTNQ